MATDKYLGPCTPGCPGWCIVVESGPTPYIARCDDCMRFEHDAAAATFARWHDRARLADCNAALVAAGQPGVAMRRD